MISQKTKNLNLQIDARVTALETELAEIKEILSRSNVVDQEDLAFVVESRGKF